MRRSDKRAALILSSLLLVAPAVPAVDPVPKQVTLHTEPGLLIASNAKLSRFDEVVLGEGEAVQRTAEGAATLVVMTNRRALGYGQAVGWRELELRPGETAMAVVAEDYAAFVRTSARYLNFNARTGRWAAADRS